MKAVIIALLIALTMSAKVAEQTEVVFSQLSSLEKDSFGKKLLDTIVLQLNNQAPLAEVAKLLQKIRENIILTQKEADAREAKNTAECRSEIHDYNKRIDRASNEISEATALIAQLNTQISGLEKKLVTNSNILKLLDARQLALRDQRKTERADYRLRQKRFEEVLAALDLIISKVRSIKPDDQKTAVKAALAELSKIGSSNPILALVQVASTFSKDTLDVVLQKLTLLRASFEASNSEDRAAEVKSDADYETLMAELGDTRRDIAQGKSETETKLRESRGALNLQKKRKTDSRFEINAAGKGKKQKQKECEAWEIEYRTESGERRRQIRMLKKVENILATKLDAVKSYAKNRK